MTLLREAQTLLERTYGKTGVDMGDFILPSKRAEELAEMAGPGVTDISDLGRVFLQIIDDRLLMGIHYDRGIIDALEKDDPRRGLNERNILPFMVFVEELDHAVHAALKFREGNRCIHTESFVRELELQAKVDTYLVLRRFLLMLDGVRTLSAIDHACLVSSVFGLQSPVHAYRDPVIAERYNEAFRLGRKYAAYLESLSDAKRPAVLREFRMLTYHEKIIRIHTVSARAAIRLHVPT